MWFMNFKFYVIEKITLEVNCQNAPNILSHPAIVKTLVRTNSSKWEERKATETMSNLPLRRTKEKNVL